MKLKVILTLTFLINIFFTNAQNNPLRINPSICTACGYCMPCPFGVNIPRNFAFYNDYHIFGDKEKTIASYNRFVKPSEKASNCAECGKCESHCPQAISIIEDLKKVEAIFEA